MFCVCLCLQKGGVAKTSADLVLDTAELEAAFTDKTKMFIFNTPHNPTGKVCGDVSGVSPGTSAARLQLVSYTSCTCR